MTPDYAEIKISFRNFDMEFDERMLRRIRALAEYIALDAGGTAKVTDSIKAPVLYNDPQQCERLLASARKIVGAENIRPVPRRISSEDFAFYAQKETRRFLPAGHWQRSLWQHCGRASQRFPRGRGRLAHGFRGVRAVRPGSALHYLIKILFQSQ